ncbi:MAG TPA: type II toxin-antitoxin system RelE/ParE family toxin [Reyranella sp.]|nr:type II toxin-antitoxin system RelE/ParE family toxin [Reyranella sp.]
MNISWSAEAIADLISLRAYIAEHDPIAAHRAAQRIIELIEDVLVHNPHIGRPGRVSGTREFVITKTLHRPISCSQRCARNLARVSRRTALARQLPIIPSAC